MIKCKLLVTSARRIISSGTKRSTTEDGLRTAKRQRPLIFLPVDVEQKRIGNDTTEYKRTRYNLPDNYYVQVGEIDFGKGGGQMESLFFTRKATENAKEFQFNIPARLIANLHLVLTEMLIESGKVVDESLYKKLIASSKKARALSAAPQAQHLGEALAEENEGDEEEEEEEPEEEEAEDEEGDQEMSSEAESSGNESE